MTLSHRLPPSPSSHPKLISSHPSSSAPAIVRISHVQLRDLIVCPAERGVLWYVGDNAILEQDIISNTPPQSIASLKFTPVTLSTLRLASSCPGGKDVLILAAGGQDAELFLGMYLYHPRRTRQRKHQQNLYEPPLDTRPQETLHLSQDISIDAETDLDVKEEEQDEHPGYSTSVWQHTSSLVGSINNNVLLYMPPPPLHEHDMYEDNEEDREVSPRLVVSNNDCTVKFFDVCLARKGLRRPPALQRPQERAAAAVDSRYWRQDPGYAYRATYEGEGWEKGSERVVRYERVGCLRLPVPVNHTSISPDGSTVLSCGDASTIYLHRILPVRDGSTLLFEPLATYTIPPPTPLPPLPPPSSSPVSQRRTFLHRYVGQNDPGGQYLPFAFVNGSWVLAGPHPYISDVSGMEIPPACFTTAWSADGMRFAVASQEGMVRVWDVRSKEPLGCAGWETGPGGAAAAAAAAAAASAASASASASDATPGATGSAQDGRDESLSSAIATAALNYDTQRALFEFTGGAPPWGVRSLKFARNASGREVLVFTEHVSRVHVIDADTFSRHDVLRIPHVQPSTSAPPQARDPHSQQYPRHHHHHHHRSSGARLPVFRPPQPSSSTSLNTPPPSTNNAPTPTNALAATQMYAIPPADLPRWLLDGAANANANVGYSYVPNFLFNTSAVWRGAEDAAVPRAGPGADGTSGANAAAATPRLATRLEGRARARRLGLVPPRISRPESEREGNNASSNSSSTNLRAPMGRVLSPSLPLTRSPDPAGTALFRTSLHDFGVEPERGEEAGNSGSDTDYQARLRRRYSAASSPGSRSGSGSGSAGTIGGGRAGRRDVMVRLREMERARRQGEAQEGSELRRRSPAILRSRDPVSAGASGVEAGSESRLRDDAQMEEDIAFHAARERERERDRAELSYRIREVRERIQAGREREQARAREEREQDELELEREHEHEREAAYTPVPEDAEGGPVLIPPLSSTRSEEDVRSVLAAHGIASVRTQALGAESTAASASAAAVEAQEEGADDARSERSQVLFASDERRPGSSSSASSSSASSTTRSSVSGVTGYTGITGVSTRAQAGSLVGEMHGASASASTSADMGSSTVPYPHAASEPGAGDDLEANENPSSSLSTTASQRRRRLDSTALMTPSIRNMRAAQAALRAMDDALDDYRMEVDEDVESHSRADPEQDVDLDEDRDAEGEEEESDSDATELDCAEPPSVLEQGRTAEGEDSSFNQEVSVSSSTSASLSSHVGTASTAQLPSSSSSISISSPNFSTPFQPTHSRSQSLPIPQPQQQRQSVPQSQPQAQSQSQSQSQPQQQQAQPQPQGQTLPPCRDLIESTDRLDIAGITFDPSGAYMYVATVDGITEWAVQGVEQRWWHTGGCL
ncbi:hypothetical protein ACEPAH_2198 [Sanghuangporus vaninii]